jgi:hypothetical protein
MYVVRNDGQIREIQYQGYRSGCNFLIGRPTRGTAKFGITHKRKNILEDAKGAE